MSVDFGVNALACSEQGKCSVVETLHRARQFGVVKDEVQNSPLINSSLPFTPTHQHPRRQLKQQTAGRARLPVAEGYGEGGGEDIITILRS